MSNTPIYKQIFRSSFLHSLIRIFFGCSSALCMIFVVRLLGPYEFGKFSLIIQLATTFGLFLSLGSASTLSKFLPEYNNESAKAHLFSQAMELSFGFCIIFIAGFNILFFFEPSFLPHELKSEKVFFIYFVCLFAFLNVFQGAFRGMGRFIQWAMIEGSNDFLARGFSLIIIYFLAASYNLVISCYLAVLIFAVGFSCFVFRSLFCVTDFKIEPRVMRFAALSLIGTIGFMITTSVDAVLLRGLLKDPAEVGYYFAGVRIPQIFQSLILAPLAIPFTYYFTSPNTRHIRDQIVKLSAKFIGAICGLVSLIIFVFAGTAIRFFYGDSYMSSVHVLQIYSFTLFLVGVQSLFGSFFIAIDKLHVFMLVGSLTIPLIIGLNFYLIPIWKSSGAALSQTVALSLQILSYAPLLLRYQIDLRKTYFVLFGGMILSIIVGLFFNLYLSIPIYILCILAGRLFSLEEIQKIQQALFSKSKRSELV